MRNAQPSRPGARGFNIWRLLITAIPGLTPSLDGNPVAWREWQRSRPSRWMMLVTLVYGGLSLLFTVLAILWRGGQSGAFVNLLQVTAGLLLLSVTAATSLAEERVRGSLDVLLSTPLTTSQIVLGKWLGTFRMVPPLAVLPTLIIWAEEYAADTHKWWLCPMMAAFVLCAGAAITSLGLAMAARFSGVGRAIGATVSVYVLITVGWFVMVSAMYGNQSQRLSLASPLLWAAITTIAAGVPHPPPISSGAFSWIIFYAVAAAALFLTTLTIFDRRLGRADDAASWLCLPSRLVRILTALYAICSLCLAVFVFFPSGDPTFTSFGSALLFALGLLLLAVRASWPLARDRSAGVADLQAAARRSGVRLLVAKWTSAGRLVPGVLLLPLMIASSDGAYDSVGWAPNLILLGFMLCVSLAAVSLGVVMFALLRGRIWATLATVALWGLSIADWFTLGTSDFLRWDDAAFGFTLPFSGVVQLCLWMRGTRAIGSLALPWILGASATYAFAAALLMALALTIARIEVRRTGHQ